LVSLALGAKRLHDRGKSGWWLLLYWIFGSGLGILGYYLLEENIIGFGLAYVMQAIGGVLTLLGFIDIGFVRGTVGANVYVPKMQTKSGHARFDRNKSDAGRRVDGTAART
jgi:uncharacterized membrane protein YhaH (DUF805 family)